MRKLLLRDVPFSAMSLDATATVAETDLVNDVVGELSRLSWFNGSAFNLTAEEQARRRSDFSANSAFRGITEGDLIGPYISQFMLAGHGGINGNDSEPGRSATDGLISYGAINIDQKIRTAAVGEDHMTAWNEWLDVQNGTDLRAQENYDPATPRRFITTSRDLATYVHYMKLI